MQSPLLAEQLSIILALMCFLVIGIAAKVGSGRLTSSTTVMTVLSVAAVVLVGGLALRWDRLEQGPFMTLYEVLHSNLFSLVLVYTLIYWAEERIRPALTVALGFFILLAIWALTSSTEPVVLPPTFDHPWLWIHIISGKIFLGFCMTAAGLAVLLLGQNASIRLDSGVDPVTHDPVIWRLLAVAFIFHSLMLIAGAVWAHDAWGRYWNWDPLETWSLLTWLSLAILLHMRLTFQMPAWLGWSLAIGVFVLAFLTFFGVPFISYAPHKGVM